MRADLEIVCGFIEAGKTAFINALNELTKIKDEDTFIILTEDCLLYTSLYMSKFNEIYC